MDKWSMLEEKMVRKYENMSNQRDRHLSGNEIYVTHQTQKLKGW